MHHVLRPEMVSLPELADNVKVPWTSGMVHKNFLRRPGDGDGSGFGGLGASGLEG